MSGEANFYMSSRYVPFGEPIPTVTEPTLLIMPCGPLPPPVEPHPHTPVHVAFENGEYVVHPCSAPSVSGVNQP
jgi:hypothetical protein